MPKHTVEAAIKRATNKDESNYEEIVYEGYTVQDNVAEMSIPAPNDFSVFPNPSNGIFTLNFSGANEKNIVVYDLMGKIVFEKNNSADATLTLDLANEATGVYLVKVVIDGEIVLKKIIKE